MTRFPYRMGDAKAICDRCGFQTYLSELQEEWTGLKTCYRCWEPRHPQDFVVGVQETNDLDGPRPAGTGNFLDAGEVTREDF